MKLTIFGLSITSSWGNGHATTYRALCEALARRGHQIVFFERNQEWYESNRDLPEPPYCDVRIYESWDDIRPAVCAALRDSDAAMVGSYFPDGIAALDEIVASNVPVKAFYDIDTPITVSGLRRQDRENGPGPGESPYVLRRHLAELDVYFSFTGGPMLHELEQELGAAYAVPLYCSVDPDKHRELAPRAEF